MNLSFLNLEFEISHATYDQLHDHDGIEIAFVGASNAGKSSAINAISTNKKIAKTSKKPGKTKLFNFFKIGVDYIVDFPGYGYSKTSKENTYIAMPTCVFRKVSALTAYKKKYQGP